MPKFTSDDKLASWFTYQKPSSDAILNAHEKVRCEFLDLAVSMNNLLPEGPDKTVVLRGIYEVSMKANAAIACAQALYED